MDRHFYNFHRKTNIGKSVYWFENWAPRNTTFIRTIIRKLGTQEHDLYTNYYSKTGHPGTRPLYELHPTKVANKYHIYRNSRTAKRNLWKKNNHFLIPGLEKWRRRLCDVRRYYESGMWKIKPYSLTENQFKCLIFIPGLTSESRDIWTRLLSKLQHDKDITIQALTTACNNLLSIKRDTMLMQKPNTPSLTGNVQSYKVKKASINMLVLWWLTLCTFLPV